jgi:hypothetical protein
LHGDPQVRRGHGHVLMSGARRWRPVVVRTAGSVTEAIYGLVLATSVIAVSREYDSSNAGLVGINVLVTGVVFWLAHVYARVLATSMAHRRMLSRSEVREVLRHDLPLVEVTVPLVLILALGVVDVVPDRVSILAATLAVFVELAAAGAYAARMRGSRLSGAGRVRRPRRRFGRRGGPAQGPRALSLATMCSARAPPRR